MTIMTNEDLLKKALGTKISLKELKAKLFKIKETEYKYECKKDFELNIAIMDCDHELRLEIVELILNSDV